MKSYAVVGSPNSGKTTLYNWLTNSRFKTVNYPGATVEYSVGEIAPHLGSGFRLMDTPGVYSLEPKSADEEVTVAALYNTPELGQVDGIILVLDGTHLERQLLMAKQVQETGFPLLIVITMADLLRSQKLILNKELLSREFNAPVVMFDGLLGGGLKDLVEEMKKLPLVEKVNKPHISSKKETETRLLELSQLAEKLFIDNSQKAELKIAAIAAQTKNIDRWLLHPQLGLLFFMAIMTILFSSIFWLAKPFMDLIADFFTAANDYVLSMEFLKESIFADFIANGIISSFSSVLVFVPQIFILFFGISILEATGYLARAATLIDRPFSLIGMSGRSFVPILSGFSCAVPAMIATRNISSRRDRLITNMVIPLMTCSARLPVYALLLSFLFNDRPSWVAGLVLAILYLGSLIIGAVAAAILNRILNKQESSLFMMELPLYRRPRLRIVLQQALARTFSYVKRAGPVIFVIAVLLWFGTNFPNNKTDNATQKLEQSYAGRLGKVLEPVVEPMGIDWRVGVGLISAFAAREVFVSSMAVVFNIADDSEENIQQNLLKEMGTAVNSRGEKVFTPSSVAGIIIFFMIALQCMSTFAVSHRENGSFKLALMQLIILNGVAYVAAVVLVQSLRALGVN